MLKKIGVDDSRLTQRMADALAIVQGECYGEIVLTETRNGVHLINSRHYRDRAVDIRIQQMIRSTKIDVEKIRKALGDEFRVIDEGDHLHIADLKE